jgi:hypothetical protein
MTNSAALRATPWLALSLFTALPACSSPNAGYGRYAASGSTVSSGSSSGSSSGASASGSTAFACQGGFDAGTASRAHSPSFYPVRAVDDTGQPAPLLHWTYRINQCQPTTSMGITLTLSDEDQTIQGSTLVQSEGVTYDSPSGTGMQTITEQLDPDAGAIIQIDIDTSARLTNGAADIMLTERFGTMPMPSVYNRSDLDTLQVGYSETIPASHGTVSSTVRSATTPVSTTGTVDISGSWSLLDKLASFAVQGTTYLDVVKVQGVVMATASILDPASGAMSTSATTTTTVNYLAKGIGTIRSESTATQQSGTMTSVGELLGTNLVPQ